MRALRFKNVANPICVVEKKNEKCFVLHGRYRERGNILRLFFDDTSCQRNVLQQISKKMYAINCKKMRHCDFLLVASDANFAFFFVRFMFSKKKYHYENAIYYCNASKCTQLLYVSYFLKDRAKY